MYGKILANKIYNEIILFSFGQSMKNINMVKERIFQDNIVEMLEIVRFNFIFNHIK
jgi:hypothetical protein